MLMSLSAGMPCLVLSGSGNKGELVMKVNTYLLPEFWASALINDDSSGLEDEDIELMNKWFAEENPGYCFDCNGEPEFAKFHDASNYVLACNCLAYRFLKE